MTGMANVDHRTVEDFGDEWETFDQSGLEEQEGERLFSSYFAVFPWHRVGSDAEGFDMGCGSGRWAKYVARRIGTLHCIDASAKALDVARRTLAGQGNCLFHHASVGALPLAPSSMDFGYSLGVLHHVPDTQAGLDACARLLKPGAPFLVYLYYAFDNRPWWFRAVWRMSDFVRQIVSRLPFLLKLPISTAIAATIYWPCARLARLLEALSASVAVLPLSAYRHSSFYTMRTDALDRFGTRLEQRFTRAQIERMLLRAGFRDIEFSEAVPFWCAVGTKR